MWHKSKKPPCLFTQTVDTCYYIPTTCLYLTSRRIVCVCVCVCVDNQYHSARIAAKSWERDQDDKGNICQQYPEYKYLPNKPVVGTVWQPLTWLSVQYTVTGAPVKQTAQLSTHTQCADAVWPHSAPNITSQAPCYFKFHQDCTVLLYIPPRHLVILHSTKTAPCYFTSPRLYHVILHSTKTEP